MSKAHIPTRDVSAQISRLFVHPVKSCAGVEVREALLTETGLELDRAWMVVDAQGVFGRSASIPAWRWFARISNPMSWC